MPLHSGVSLATRDLFRRFSVGSTHPQSTDKEFHHRRCCLVFEMIFIVVAYCLSPSESELAVVF